jgi:hypothetical protein
MKMQEEHAEPVKCIQILIQTQVFFTKSCKKFTAGHFFHCFIKKNAIIFFSGLDAGLLNVPPALQKEHPRFFPVAIPVLDS